jgi:hypothetical protein
MKDLNGRAWSPYLAGTLNGLVMILSALISGKYIGVSTTFVRSVGMVEKLFNAERVAQMDYLIKVVPKVDWQWMFVLNVFIGSLIASTTSESFRWKTLPPMWEERFGSARIKQFIVAFVGGVIGTVRARLADG